jgi:hypothetical protein
LAPLRENKIKSIISRPFATLTQDAKAQRKATKHGHTVSPSHFFSSASSAVDFLFKTTKGAE